MKKQLYRILEELKNHYKANEALIEQVISNRQLFPESYLEAMTIGHIEYAFILKEFEDVLPPRKN